MSVLTISPIGDHCAVKPVNGPAARRHEDAGHDRVKKARQPCQDHRAGEPGGHPKMLRVGLTDAAGMVTKQPLEHVCLAWGWDS